MADDPGSEATETGDSEAEKDSESPNDGDQAEANAADQATEGETADKSEKAADQKQEAADQKDGGDEKADEKKAGEDKSAEKAETKYEAFDVPDGMELDQSAIDAAAPLFEELGLSQEAAQKLVTFYAGQLQSATDARVDKWAEMQDAGRKGVEEHPTLGGKNLDENLALASKAIDEIVDKPEDLRAALDATGAGNSPIIFEALVNVGKIISEDSYVSGRGGPGQPKRDPAEILYGEDKAKEK